MKYNDSDNKNNQQLRDQINVLEKTVAELKSQTKFSSENPNPIMRINLNDVLLYANEAALLVFSSWKLQVGKAVPKALQELIQELEGPFIITRNIPYEGRLFSFSAILLMDAKYINIYVDDITERKQVENEMQLLQTITQVIAESPDLHSALEVTLHKVAEATRWNFGEVWLPNSKGTALESGLTRYKIKKELEKFRRLSEGFTFPPGVGLPGRVWSSKKPEWIKNTSTVQVTNFVRKQLVLDFGLKAGFGVPIISHGNVMAVLVFFMFESSDEDRRLTKLVSAVAAQLGLVLQRKLAEEELRKSELWMKNTFKALEEAVFVVTTDRVLINSNKAAEKMFGYTQEEFSNQSTYIAHVDQDHYVEFGKLIKASFGMGRSANFEFEMKRKDGEIFPTEHTVSLLKDDNGKPMGIVSVVRDITERKQAEEDLNKLSVAMQQSPVSTLITDAEGNIEYVNPKFSKLTGYLAEEVLGKNPNMLKSGVTPESVFKELWNTITKGETWAGEIINKKKNGELFWVSSKISPILDDKNNITHFIAINEDITERKEFITDLMDRE